MRNLADDRTGMAAAVVGAALVIVAGAWVFLGVSAGPIARHMAVHILIMNVVAPLAAVAASPWIRFTSPRTLWIATLAQLAILALWHTLSPHGETHATSPLALGLLLVIAGTFWLAVFTTRSRGQALAALLLTGKIVCLGGALLIFAPGALYHGIDRADQQLAGLLMVTACPLSYLASALVLAIRAIDTSGADIARA